MADYQQGADEGMMEMPREYRQQGVEFADDWLRVCEREREDACSAAELRRRRAAATKAQEFLDAAGRRKRRGSRRRGSRRRGSRRRGSRRRGSRRRGSRKRRAKKRGSRRHR